MSVWRAIRERMVSFLDAPSNATLRRLLLDQGTKHWKGYVFAFAMMGLIALTTSLSAWIIGKIVDKIFVGHNLNAVWEITAAIVAIYAVKGFATYGQQVSLSRVANSIVADIQKRIFDQMLRMKVSYYSQIAFVGIHRAAGLHRPIGQQRPQPADHDLVARRAHDRRPGDRDGVAGPLLSLLALMFVPVAAVGVRKIGLRVRRIMASEFQGAMQMMESLQETAQGIRIVKAFTLEGFMRDRQAAAIRSFQTAANKLAAGEFAHEPDHGEPGRLRHRRSGALQRLHRHHSRQSAGEPLLLHHFGHHALRADEAGGPVPR